MSAVLENMFLREPEATEPIETPHRRIVTPLPAPESVARLREAAAVFPQVNTYQAPVIWDRAEGFTVSDAAGNRWIDFSSTAVMTNTGHGHPRIREAVAQHAESELLAQFSFASEIRIELARRLANLAPAGLDKVWFWTVGSEAIECAFRMVREWGKKHSPRKFHLLTHAGDYHGWTLAAHQMSGDQAAKPWLSTPDQAIHHVPFPTTPQDSHRSPDKTDQTEDQGADHWTTFWQNSLAELARQGITAEDVCGIFFETFQGWGALPLPRGYVEAVRRWADEHDVLVIFDEVQTGFGRTGRLWGHEHYDVRPDLLCIGKGLTSTLPLAAVLGPGDILDLLPPGEITTTHAAHPLSCAAALANLEILEDEQLIRRSAELGEIARRELEQLRERFPQAISAVTGRGLLQAVHVQDPATGQPSRELARDWTWTAVKRGVMLFQTNRATVKVCPPLVITEAALIEGITALGDALEQALAVPR